MTGKRSLSNRAKLFVLTTVGVAAATLAPNISSVADSRDQWLLFAVLAIGATISQLFPVVTPKNQAYHVTPVFVFAGVLLLHPTALALLVLIAFTCEWLKVKYPLYIELFNVSNFLLDAFVARAVYELVLAGNSQPLGSLAGILAAALAAVLFTIANHVLLAVVLRIARGHSWRQTGLFDVENFLTDATLACIGIITALLWQATPLVVLLVAAPMYLIYRSLNTPNLQEQARTDDKTGLYNTRRFQQVLAEELRRAERFGRPLTVIMADMDLLRNINNSYGHLAGDVVLKGVAAIIKDGLREFDLAARFGGEEFAILLPETAADQGLAIAERLRTQVEDARFEVATSVRPIQATLSLGVAAFPEHGRIGDEVIHQADLAVYYAKLRGRNRAWACSPESMALGETMGGRRAAEAAPSGEDISKKERGESTDSASESARAGMDRSSIGEQPAGSPNNSSPLAAPVQVEVSCSPLLAEAASRAVGRKGDFTLPVGITVGIVVAVTAALWAFARPWQGDVDWIGLASLALLTVAAQGMAIDIYGRGKVSVSAILLLASGALWGIPASLPLALLVGVVTAVISRGAVHRALFDIGNVSIAGTMAAGTFQIIAGLLSSSEPYLLLIPVAAAALVYYAANIGLLSVAMGLGERRSPIATWRERFRWLLPHYLTFGVLALVIVLAYRAIGIYGLLVFFIPPLMLRYAMKQYIHRTEENVAELTKVNRQVIKAHDEVVGALRELRATYDATVTALSVALDSRDSETEGHSRRVVEYTMMIARKMGVSSAELSPLLKGALLHDVGKIGIPDAILKKPGPLTAAEWAIMRTHPEQGCRMLAHIHFLEDALAIVQNHHERCDGTGYPNGLKGDEIPVGARIFAVADAYDAMTSQRPYRAPSSPEHARQEILRCAGKQFDPEVVEAFLAIGVEELEALNSGERQVLEGNVWAGLQQPISSLSNVAA